MRHRSRSQEIWALSHWLASSRTSEGWRELRGVCTHSSFSELGIAPVKLVVDVGREVLEPRYRECSKLLSSLVPFWMEIVADGEERNSYRSFSHAGYYSAE